MQLWPPLCASVRTPPPANRQGPSPPAHSTAQPHQLSIPLPPPHALSLFVHVPPPWQTLRSLIELTPDDAGRLHWLGEASGLLSAEPAGSFPPLVSRGVYKILRVSSMEDSALPPPLATPGNTALVTASQLPLPIGELLPPATPHRPCNAPSPLPAFPAIYGRRQGGCPPPPAQPSPNLLLPLRRRWAGSSPQLGTAAPCTPGWGAPPRLSAFRPGRWARCAMQRPAWRRSTG